MNKINYQKLLDKQLSSLGKETPTLLLHSCCAPCSSYCIEYLSQFFKITVYYYNPNIFPDEEYQYRAKEQQRLISEMPTKHPVKYISSDYDSHNFFETVKGLENEPEGGKRCQKCFELRLRKTAIKASELDFDYFTTTLTISPLKNAQLINEIGMHIADEFNVVWLPSDFKKNEGYKRSIQLSKDYNLYRQNYCGCVFSKNKSLNI